MSLTDPLIKQLKAVVIKIRLNDNKLKDGNLSLFVLCETLERIIRKGIIHNFTIFGQCNKEYWNFIHKIEKANFNRFPFPVSFAINNIREMDHLNALAKGRLFIRTSLQNKLLSKFVSFCSEHTDILQTYYNSDSILGHPILSVILLSLIQELEIVDFSLELKNSSFLDKSLQIPIHKNITFVPCPIIGIHVRYIENKLLVIAIDEDSVAHEHALLKEGDVIVSILSRFCSQQNMAKIGPILRDNINKPIDMTIVKCHLEDGTLFSPIAHLLRISDLERLRKIALTCDPSDSDSDIIPLHTQLKKDGIEDRVPVHGNDRAQYRVNYLGEYQLAKTGTVDLIEMSIVNVIARPRDIDKVTYDYNMNLSETQVDLEDKDKKKILSQSYTEVSCCGRISEDSCYFAFIAGNTTCNMADLFIGYVFRSQNVEQAKQIVCCIAQGFERTHWAV